MFLTQSITRPLAGLILAVSFGSLDQAAEDFATPGDMADAAQTPNWEYWAGGHLGLRFSLSLGFDASDNMPAFQNNLIENSAMGLGLVAGYRSARGLLRLGGGAVISGAGFEFSDPTVAGQAGQSRRASAAGQSGQMSLDVSPYLTLGYGHRFSSGWAVRGDVSAVVAGGEDEFGSDRGFLMIADWPVDVVPHVRIGANLKF
jgi:hypothetical protein